MRQLILAFCVMFTPLAAADLTLIYDTPEGRLHFYVKDGETLVRMPDEKPIVYAASADELRVLDRQAGEYHVVTARELQSASERRRTRDADRRFERTNTFMEVNGLMTRLINYRIDGRPAGTLRVSDRHRLGITDADWKTLQGTMRALSLADPFPSPDHSRLDELVVEQRGADGKRQMVLSVLLNAPVAASRIPAIPPEWRRIEVAL